jgi:hypothetical protein
MRESRDAPRGPEAHGERRDDPARFNLTPLPRR